MKLPATVDAFEPRETRLYSAIMRNLRRAEKQLERVARRRWLACAMVILIAMGMRVALLPLLPPRTASFVPDEFSYLLGGETFAMGRLANPPHPMWRFFENNYQNMRPTYGSMYPPAQAAFLAVGIRLFGNPWYGVWLSMGLLCGAVCWMLQGWLPPKYAIIGGVLTAMQVGVASYWINSYWGGAVAALGGALAIGALPRLARKPSAGAAAAAAAAILVLANSRPFEGVILLGLLGVGFMWWVRRCGSASKVVRAAVILPLVSGILVTAGFMAYYNWRTTGDPRLMPYLLNSREHHWSKPLWILPASSRPATFRDSAMKDLWTWDNDVHMKARQNPLRVIESMRRAVFDTFVEGAGLALIPFVIGGFLLVSSLRARIAASLLLAFMCLLLLEQFIQPHYIAPALGLMVLVLMFGMQLFRTMKVRGKEIGLGLVASMLCFSVLFFFGDTFTSIMDLRNHAMTPMKLRAKVLEQLNTKPGPHLVMVRYGPNHNFIHEQVYNGPDIDSQKVVWALDRDADDRALFAYYPDRTVWLFQPDGPEPSIEPWH